MASSDSGKVYVMKDGDRYKIGQSVDPGDRLHQVKDNHPNAKIIATFDAKNKLGAENAAQEAVQYKLGMRRQEDGSDWFRGHSKADDINKIVGSAVQSSNDRQ